MLLKHTILYLPAQLLPAIAQFTSLIFWSHFADPEVIGIVTLFISIQEFLVMGFMGFWSSYTVRFGMTPVTAEEERLREQTSTAVVFGSSIIQSVVAAALYVSVIDRNPPFYLVAILMTMAWGRAFNHFQGERGRARGDVLLYSVETITGPLIGMAMGLAMLSYFGSSEVWILLSYAVAQAGAAVFGLCRDRSWLRFGRVDVSVLRRALSYGAPLILSSTFMWGVQNTPRWLVSAYLGLAAAGVYSLGFGLGFRVAVVAAMSVNAAAFPLAVKLANKGDHAGAMKQLSKNAILLMAVLSSSMVGLALVSSDVVDLVIAAPLRESVAPVMLWSLFAGSMICVRQYFLNQVFLLKGNTRIIGMISCAELVPAVILALILVPKLGAVGGAMSLALTSFSSTSIMFIKSTREGLLVPWIDFFKISIATAVMALAVVIMPSGANLATLIGRIGVGGTAFIVTIAALYYRQLIAIHKGRKSHANSWAE